MDRFFIVSQIQDPLFGLVDHIPPSAQKKVGRLDQVCSGVFVGGGQVGSTDVFVNGMHISLATPWIFRANFFPGVGRQVSEIRYTLGQILQLSSVQGISEFSTTEDQVDIMMGNVVVDQMMRHGAKGGNAGSGADEKQVAVDEIGQCKYTLWSAQCQGGAYLYVFEQPGGAQPSFKPDDHQFEDVGSVGPAGDGVAPPAFVGFFVDGQIERNELSRLKIELLEFLDPNPEPPGGRGFILPPDYGSGAPGLQSHQRRFESKIRRIKDPFENSGAVNGSYLCAAHGAC